MISLDLFTTSFVTAVVIVASATVFLLETVVRRESGSGRYWAAAYVAGILVIFSYAAWTVDRGLWIAVAIGNAGFVGQLGLMWLGCRVYNGRLGVAHRLAVAAVVLLTLAVSIAQRQIGDWAGAPVMFAGIALFALLGALETLRGALREVFAAWGLTFVLGAAAVYYLGRTLVFLVAGPESELFTEWFGTVMTSLVTIALTIIAVVSTSVLRVVSTASPAVPGGTAAGRDGAALLSSDTFRAVVEDLAGRSERAGSPLAVVAIRIAEVAEIGTAFGHGAAELVESSWQDAVRRHLPLHVVGGSLDESTAALVLLAPDAADAAAHGDELRQGLIDDLAGLEDAVLPAIGVGYALASDHGYDANALLCAAADAARRSAADTAMPVLQATR
ncbi:hypothetical protein [Microbacterium sp. JZ31]|uniref:hypothetical protein n=1 Tax=Microbacterium sp. JZ31 TaxID=1906274 RepID=UPI0019320812|nr:hypothetical protein [Microbacterium sp. JZ31]